MGQKCGESSGWASNPSAVIAANPEAGISKSARIAADLGIVPLTAAIVARARSDAQRTRISAAAYACARAFPAGSQPRRSMSVASSRTHRRMASRARPQAARFTRLDGCLAGSPASDR
jgi:hypothetical protein